MKKILCTLVLLAAPVLVHAQEEGALLQNADTNLNNTASLQRGAKYFVNYCMGCHSAKYVRYNRIGQDLGLNDVQLETYLMFAGGKTSDTMDAAMPSADSEKWFGRTPPDLSLEVRSRGADWVYTYLKSFYLDDKAPTGVNNLVLPNAAMPDVLWELQGLQKAVFEQGQGKDGVSFKQFSHFEQVTPGKLTPEQYDQVARDLTNFLAYVSEPMELESRDLGLKVIGFLIIFFLFAYLLKREIWKRVH